MKTKVLFSCILLSVLLVSCHSEPQPIKVTGITLNSSSLSLIEGETADLTATISPKDADNKTVIWSSSNGSVAGVSNGKVTALSPGSTTITAKSDDGGFTATCVVSVAPRVIAVTSITLSKTELTLVEGESETITATVQPDNATNKTVTWSSSDVTIAVVEGGKITAVKEGTTTISAKAGEQSSTCKVIVKPESINGHKFIEMGDGLKWAKTNVGADTPEGYGDFFAWGETSPYYENGSALSDSPTWKNGKNEGYAWPSYFDSPNGDGKSFEKYDNGKKIKLDLEDDTARSIWGGSWRIPTPSEWEWLYKNCSIKWTDDFNGTGVSGHILTSKVQGYEGNSIFLPAAGYRHGVYLEYVKINGAYWASSLNEDSPTDAWCLRFGRNGYNLPIPEHRGSVTRIHGYSIRPVSD